MSLMMMLVSMSKAPPAPATSITFTSTQLYVVPAGVTLFDTVSGIGAAGTASYSDPDVSVTVQVARVIGDYEGAGSEYLVSNWDRFTTHANAMQQKINAGGSGSDPQGLQTYRQYETDAANGGGRRATITSSAVSWANAIAGSATVSFIAWNMVGPVFVGDDGKASVTYKRKGTLYPATTGMAASAFGKTFPGGTGGPAVAVTYTSVPVSPSQQYQITVPTGGSVTITFRK